jgi:hypothetical protein
MLIPTSDLRDVHGVTPEKKYLIKAFMQGAVYSWVKNRMGDQFTVRDLVGGENYNWEGTPLQVLYDRHVESGKDHDAAVLAAAIDLGRLTKIVLHEDRRHFKNDKVGGKHGETNSYLWVGNEP